MKKVKVIGFWYDKKEWGGDEDLFIPKGEYEYEPIGINGWPMIKVNGTWLDVTIIEEIIDN